MVENREIATLFTGGDGFGVGAQAAGLKPLWGVEIDPAIADWAELNSPGLSVIRASVTDVDYTALARPYWLHMSPVCKNASVAKQGGEAAEDLAMAAGCIKAIEALQPPVVSLENVYPYREFQAFKSILGCLHQGGYAFDYWHLNTADYGVPQTRKRLILIARKDRKPQRPPATHCEGGEAARLFGPGLLPWNSWYSAIQDLIPTLPDSQFAKWQLGRLPAELRTLLINTGNTNLNDARPGKGVRLAGDPANTIHTQSNGSMPRAFILGQGQRSMPSPEDCPADTITGNSNQTGVRAFIVGGQHETTNGGNARRVQNRSCDGPVWTITASEHGDTRAFIVNGENGGNEWGKMFREVREPGYSVSANSATPRALANGRVVSLTVRALARLQSFPDSYQLPDKKSLAVTIVGNAVPPLLAQRIVESEND